MAAKCLRHQPYVSSVADDCSQLTDLKTQAISPPALTARKLPKAQEFKLERADHRAPSSVPKSRVPPARKGEDAMTEAGALGVTQKKRKAEDELDGSSNKARKVMHRAPLKNNR